MPAEPGSQYRHFKGALYVCVAIAQHTETEEVLVVYKREDKSGRVWARPLSMWDEEVEWPDGERRPRFAPEIR